MTSASEDGCTVALLRELNLAVNSSLDKVMEGFRGLVD